MTSDAHVRAVKNGNLHHSELLVPLNPRPDLLRLINSKFGDMGGGGCCGGHIGERSRQCIFKVCERIVNKNLYNFWIILKRRSQCITIIIIIKMVFKVYFFYRDTVDIVAINETVAL